MGVEYEAHIEPDGGASSLHSLRLTLEKESQIEIFPEIDLQKIRFRWTSRPLDPKWPEDVTISLDTNRLIITFHSSARSVREELLRKIEAATQLHFDEI
jgi:hypothetical protein